MAETKLNAAVRPNQGVRRTTTHSGVTHIREFQPDRYTIVGNHLAQHRELSLTAIGLATHILSLPESAPVDIRSLADRFPEGRDRIAFALRELETYGYLERVRERTEAGRLVTRTYAYNAPALTQALAAAQVPDEPVVPAAGVAPVTPVAPVAPVTWATPVSPVAPVATAACVAEDAPGPEKPVPPTPEAVAEPEPPRSEHHDKAESLLVGLRRADARFTLSRRDVRRLIPEVVAWFDNGAGEAAVQNTLTSDLPALVKHPAGFLAYRLRELLPPPLPSAPEPSAAPSGDAEPSLPYPMQDCEGECNRVFRAPEPGRCRDCRDRGSGGRLPVGKGTGVAGVA